MNSKLKKRMKQEHYNLVSIDLFSGPGGLCTGFKWAGILPLIAVEWTDTTVQTYSVTHNTDVFELSKYTDGTSVNENYLKEFLSENSKSIVIHGDINLVSESLIKQILNNRFGIDSVTEFVDVVSGGAPCESFSLAGTRTIGDERDDLFSNIIRIARAVNSKMILFENVKGLFSKQGGAIFKYICDSFEDKTKQPSYHLVSKNQNEILLKACDYGVPQLRERLFLISIRDDLSNIDFSYPEKEYGPGRKHPYVTAYDAISDLPKVEMNQEKTTYNVKSNFRNKNQEHFISIVRGEYEDESMHTAPPKHLISNGLFNDNSISCHKGPGHIKRKQELLALIPEGESMRSTYEKLEAEGKLLQYRDLFPNIIYGSRNRRLLKNEPSFTVTSHCLDEILHFNLNRAITPREAARLQSFPDWYQFAGPYVQFHGDKEQDKYEQIGDAIPPLLAFALAKQIVTCLTK